MLEDQLKQNRYTDDELGIIKAMFEGDNGLRNLKLMRKVFSPQYDYDLPIGRDQEVILWQNLSQLTSMAPSDREIAILSQIKLVKHIETILQGLLIMANKKEETIEDLGKRIQKNSAK